MLSVLSLWCFAQEPEPPCFFIQSLEVAPKKPEGKDWDAFKGKPDLLVVLYYKNPKGAWKKQFKSSVFEDQYQIHKLQTSFLIEEEQELKIEILDKDGLNNDLIGSCVLKINPSEFSKGEEKTLKFDSVSSLVYCLKIPQEEEVGEILELHNTLEPDSEPLQLPLRLVKTEKKVQVQRKQLLDLPMEYLAFSTVTSSVELFEFPKKTTPSATAIKAILEVFDKISKTISNQAEFLEEFVNHIPCVHPESGQEIPFKEFLRYYIQHNGYFQEGYFKGSDLDKDPVGVFLRLLLFDKWVLYEVKILRGEDQKWYSIEDCFKGLFKSRYSHLALDSLKNALQFTDEAKSFSSLQLLSKLKAFKNILVNYMNACLYIVESNRSFLLRRELTSKAFEKIRGVSIKAKLFARYRKSLKVEVLESF